MTLVQKLRFGMEIVGVFLSIVFLLWVLIKIYIKYCRNKNPKYNQFGKTPLTLDEKTFIAKWRFDITHEDARSVVQRLHPDMKNTEDEFDDFELRVEFNQERDVVKSLRS